MQLGLSHVVFDVLGPGKGNCKLPDSDVLGCATEGVIVDGPDGSSREIVAPVFSMKEDPVIRGVFQMGRVRGGGVTGMVREEVGGGVYDPPRG